MWMVAASNKQFEGSLGSYSSLRDQNLAPYFSDLQIRKHLVRAGLITRKGEILSPAKYKKKLVELEKDKEARELFASAIVHKTIDLERKQRAEIHQHFEDAVKIEVVERVRSSRSKTPNPRSRNVLSSFPNPTSYHVDTHQNSTFPSILSKSFSSNCNSSKKLPDLTQGKSKENCKSSKPSNEFYIEIAKAMLRYPISPYIMPMLGSIKKQGRRRHRSVGDVQRISSGRSGRRSKNREMKSVNGRLEQEELSTALEMYEFFDDNLSENRMKSARLDPAKGNCKITLQYQGSSQALGWAQPDSSEEILILQQHSKTNSIVTYRAFHKPGDSLKFKSRRRPGYFFSMVIFVNGVRHLQLSACCEFRYHPPGAKLGGKMGFFILVKVEGGAPCFKCQTERKFGFLSRPKTPVVRKNKSALSLSMENSSISLPKKSEPVSSNTLPNIGHFQQRPKVETVFINPVNPDDLNDNSQLENDNYFSLKQYNDTYDINNKGSLNSDEGSEVSEEESEISEKEDELEEEDIEDIHSIESEINEEEEDIEENENNEIISKQNDEDQIEEEDENESESLKDSDEISQEEDALSETDFSEEVEDELELNEDNLEKEDKSKEILSDSVCDKNAKVEFETNQAIADKLKSTDDNQTWIEENGYSTSDEDNPKNGEKQIVEADIHADPNNTI